MEVNLKHECNGICASIVISGNLPCRTGLSTNAGPGKDSEWTPGGRGWEAEAGELGGRRQERSACLTTGLPGYGQGCCLRVVVLQHQKLFKKRCHFERSFREGFDFGCQGAVFLRVLVGSRRCPASFFTGVSRPSGQVGAEL